MISTLLTGLGATIAPTSPISMVAARELAIARDRWLLGVLAVGSVWLAGHGALWLALVALWHLCRWRDPTVHASLLLWIGVGATWGLLRSLPAVWWFDFIAGGWLAIAAVQVGVCVHNWRTRDWSLIKRPSLGRRSKGTLGSPVLTAFLFVLVAPFCPWWAWPGLALGLYLTCSWSAMIGLGVVLIWLWPFAALPVALASAGAVLAWWWSPMVRGQRLLEWLPRGDSIDGWVARWILTRLLLRHWWSGTHRWLGHGPSSATRIARQWSSRLGVELPNGEAHNDPVQTLYEMGALGALAALAFVAPILLNLRLGDPWSAAWLAGLVLSFGHWPLRHPILGLMWLVISARLA